MIEKLIQLSTVITDWLGQRPVIGSILSATGAATGSMINNPLDLVEQLFRIGAYGMAILSGLFTIIGIISKWVLKLKNKKQNELSN